MHILIIVIFYNLYLISNTDTTRKKGKKRTKKDTRNSRLVHTKT